MTDTTIIDEIVERLSKTSIHPEPIAAMVRTAFEHDIDPGQMIPDLMLFTAMALSAHADTAKNFDTGLDLVINMLEGLRAMGAGLTTERVTEH